MNIRFWQVDKQYECDWALDIKESRDITSAEVLACDMVYTHLNALWWFFVCGDYKFDYKTTDETFWCNNKLCTSEEFTTYINGLKYEVLYVYVTICGNIMVNCIDEEGNDYLFKVEY